MTAPSRSASRRFCNAAIVVNTTAQRDRSVEQSYSPVAVGSHEVSEDAVEDGRVPTSADRRAVAAVGPAQLRHHRLGVCVSCHSSRHGSGKARREIGCCCSHSRTRARSVCNRYPDPVARSSTPRRARRDWRCCSACGARRRTARERAWSSGLSRLARWKRGNKSKEYHYSYLTSRPPRPSQPRWWCRVATRSSRRSPRSCSGSGAAAAGAVQQLCRRQP